MDASEIGAYIIKVGMPKGKECFGCGAPFGEIRGGGVYGHPKNGEATCREDARDPVHYTHGACLPDAAKKCEHCRSTLIMVDQAEKCGVLDPNRTRRLAPPDGAGGNLDPAILREVVRRALAAGEQADTGSAAPELPPRSEPHSPMSRQEKRRLAREGAKAARAGSTH